MKFPVRKKWGQNFLIDQNIQCKIVESLELRKNDEVLEIGPGYGALTKLIAPSCKKLTVIELDPLLADEIRNLSFPNVKVVNQDFLKINLNSMSKNIKFIGNLPYYITTPIMFKILEMGRWKKCVFMIQKEVAERLTSKPGKKSYGRLTVTAGFFGNIKIEFIVSPNVFQPKPKVDSAIISITQNDIKKYSNQFIKNFKEIVRIAFSSRRKILKNTIKPYLKENMMDKYGKKRPEECSIHDYIEIVNSCDMLRIDCNLNAF
ncbi:MAG: ribosomal RNA small subunit methyltransferase A [Candidatus Marinimicrobia bacterium]|nr:ribosomal RNA small subunit methyltransferase A [Candidatus Neomarinimicrobiota bacterium]|tara:strand:- start:3 stop:785 length:783 start_codon:yes stop_codon:yes gene_type:complete